MKSVLKCYRAFSADFIFLDLFSDVDWWSISIYWFHDKFEWRNHNTWWFRRWTYYFNFRWRECWAVELVWLLLKWWDISLRNFSEVCLIIWVKMMILLFRNISEVKLIIWETKKTLCCYFSVNKNIIEWTEYESH